MEKKVVLTFDYELFLGKKPGTVENCLLRPSEEIMSILKRTGARAVFFVDTMFLELLKEHDSVLFEEVKSQLQAFVANGSELGLHIHPQWLDAIYENGAWSFKHFNRFRMTSLDENQLNQVFSSGQAILEECGMRAVSFRAGGWSVQPFSHIKKAFEKHGLKIDSSIIPGFYKNEKPAHFYDYKKIITDDDCWRFDNDPTLETEGPFWEIPVGTYSTLGLRVLINFVLRKICSKPFFGDGVGLSSSEKGKKLFLRLFIKNRRKLTVEGISFWMFRHGIAKMKKRNFNVYVMHPKTMDETSLKCLEYLCNNYKTLTMREFL